MSKFLDRIDAAIFAVVDGFFALMWNEFGVKWARIVTIGFGVSYVLQTARESKWGTAYTFWFWVWSGGLGFAMLMLSVIANVTPETARAAMNRISRTSTGARFWRLMWIMLLAMSIPEGQRSVLTQATILVSWLLWEGCPATGPRQRRRSLVYAPQAT